MLKLASIIFTSALLFLIISCSAPGVRQPVEKPSPAEITEGTPVSEWDKVLAKASKEGKVVVYTSYGPGERDVVSEGFSKRTGIAVEMVAGRGSDVTAKLITERRNGLFLVDVYLGGTTNQIVELKPNGALAPLEPILFLAEVLDTKLWYNNTLPWVDKDKLVMQVKANPGGTMDVAFNINLARKEDFQSWYDVLKPKFKGKMNMIDPTRPSRGSKFINSALTFHGMDWDFMRALAKQEPVITADKRLMLEWVAKGKHIVALLPSPEVVLEFQAAGAPMGTAVMKGYKSVLGGSSSGVALIDRAPHPNAASLLINWFLSKEGQTAYARSQMIQSAREDVPTDHLPPENIREPGVVYPSETEEFLLQEAKLRPMILEIFGPLVR